MTKFASRIIARYNDEIISGSVIRDDALDFLKRIESGTAGIVFLDPPFNLGKCYGENNRHADKKPVSVYTEWMKQVIIEAVRILAEGGALYLYHMPIWAMRFGADLDGHLEFRNWIAISMKGGFARGQRLYPAHYALLVFTKGKPAAFTRLKIDAKRCRHCGKLVKDYGGYRRIIEDQGINLSDFWEDLSPVRHANHKHRTANELPRALFERVIGMSGVKEQLFVDPFAGSGTGAIQAVEAGMRFLACDIELESCRILHRRLEDYRVQMIQRRSTDGAKIKQGN